MTLIPFFFFCFLLISGKETAETGPSASATENYVQPGTDAQPGDGISEQRVRVAEQEIGISQRTGLIGDASENLVSKP